MPFAVVVVGHSECGGATACLNASVQLLEDEARTPCCDPSQPAEAPLNRWLAPLTKPEAIMEEDEEAGEEKGGTLYRPVGRPGELAWHRL